MFPNLFLQKNRRIPRSTSNSSKVGIGQIHKNMYTDEDVNVYIYVCVCINICATALSIQ